MNVKTCLILVDVASCALDGCQSPECQVCTVTARFQVTPCSRTVDGERCVKIAKHPYACVSKHGKGKAERAELKDSKPVPDLSGPRAASQSLAFQKRKREGAFRQQRGFACEMPAPRETREEQP